jgi:hypothetical protein
MYEHISYRDHCRLTVYLLVSPSILTGVPLLLSRILEHGRYGYILQ